MSTFTDEQKNAISNALEYQTGWMTDEVKADIRRLLESTKVEMNDTSCITGLVFDLIFQRDRATGEYKHSYKVMTEKSSELYDLLRKYGNTIPKSVA